MKRTAFLLITVAMALSALPAFAAGSYFKVATQDVATAIADALTERGAAEKVKASVYSGKDELYESDKPLSVAVQALTFDKDAQRWQANMHVLSEGKTVSVMPIQGRYEPVSSVPVLNRHVNHSDIISDADISWKDMETRKLRKDTVMDISDLLGKTPRRTVSKDRPIRFSEIDQPALVKKGAQVAVRYSSPYMHIQTIGQALEDGAKGSLVRVQNPETKRAFTARVTNTNQVEANLAQSL